MTLLTLLTIAALVCGVLAFGLMMWSLWHFDDDYLDDPYPFEDDLGHYRKQTYFIGMVPLKRRIYQEDDE